MSLFQTYKQNKAQLMTSMGKKNTHQLPRVDKVIVSIGIWSLATRKWMKDFSEIEQNLALITGQKPQMILSKKAVSNFKLREWMPAMLRCTLRWERAYDFIQRLVVMVLPRVRDFEGLSLRKFDQHGNYHFWFPSISVFPELTPESIKTDVWTQVSICTTADVNVDAQKLLESLGILFEKKLQAAA